MNEILDQIGRWLTDVGIHPVLGAFGAGLVAGLILRGNGRRGAVDGSTDTGLAAAMAASQPGMFSKSSVMLEHGATSLAINGTPIPIGAKAMAELVAKIKSGHTVDAIKLAREETGLGLTESKLLVDTLAKSSIAR